MKLLKSKKGFTLIELLVVIGILAVLAAIAIPSVAGLIDRANVSADATNANEMTNALERFTSEYELYCQDLASGKVDTNNLDAAQGRVYNVTGVTDRAGIENLEKDATAGVDTAGKAIYRDTKYPVNAETMQAVVENYMKTSSTTFTPKQSDCNYYYSPDCGLVVCTETAESDVEDLNKLVQSGKDAKGNILGASTKWINITTYEPSLIIPASGGAKFALLKTECACDKNAEEWHEGLHTDACYEYAVVAWEDLTKSENGTKFNYDASTISTTSIRDSFGGCEALIEIVLPQTLKEIRSGAFHGTNIQSVIIPDSVTTIEDHTFSSCYKLTDVVLPKNLTFLGHMAFEGSNLENVTMYPGPYSLLEGTFSVYKKFTINFQGTTAQWASISKYTGPYDPWYGNKMPTVKCLDGTI